MKRATGLVIAAAVFAAASAWGADSQVVGFRSSVVITASLPGATPADRAVRQKLEETPVTFTFNEQPFEEAMQFLAALGDVNIVVDHAKVEAGKTITLKLTEVPLLTALKLSVEQAGLKWAVRDGVVVISTEDGVKSEPVTGVYDVTDMLHPAPDFEGPEISLGNMATRSSKKDNTDNTLGNPFNVPPTDKPKKDSEKTQDELLKEIVELVKQMVDSGTWEQD